MSNRRDFLKKAGGLALLTIVPRSVLGGTKFVAPSDQLTKGIIGVGGIGKSSYHFTSNDACRLVAVCDVDRKHLESAIALGRKKFDKTLESYHDYRDLITDPNVDIVHIATPPHWHGIMAVEAAKAGKDIWCEKPMTRTIGEGKRVVEAVRQNGRIFRLNTWFRFKDTFYGLGTTVEPLKKLVDSGLLGWPLKVTISGATGFTWKFFWVGQENLKPQSVPEELDYDMWLGPAPYKPYNKHRVHATVRGYWDYDGGGLTDMGQHYMDPVQYLLGKDDTSPVKIEVDAPQRRGHLAQDRIHLRRRLSDRPRRRGLRKQGQGPLHRRSAGQGVSGFRVHDSRRHGEDRRNARPRTAEHRFPGMRAQPRAFRPRRAQGTPQLHAREPRRVRPAPEPHAAFRSRQAALRRRRGRKPAHRPADAHAVENLITSKT